MCINFRKLKRFADESLKIKTQRNGRVSRLAFCVQTKKIKLMRTGGYYLNNSGSRWVVFDVEGRNEKRTWVTKSGKIIIRRVIYYESFGNFGSCLISYKGKKIKVLSDTILED